MEKAGETWLIIVKRSINSRVSNGSIDEIQMRVSVRNYLCKYLHRM